MQRAAIGALMGFATIISFYNSKLMVATRPSCKEISGSGEKLLARGRKKQVSLESVKE